MIKKKIQEIFLSKRFLAFLICIIIFLVVVLFTDKDVLAVATSLTMLSGIYVAGESIRSSVAKMKEEEKG